MGYLVLVRHGESRWNLSNRFTGWVDVPLSEQGIYEALVCSEKLENLSFDIAFTSKLERAQETLLIILSKQDCTGIFLHDTGKEKTWAKYSGVLWEKEIPVYMSTALNERYYGKLQGMNKEMARKKWGTEKVFKWRRSWDISPPGGEALKDTYNRTIPYFKKTIMPQVRKNKDVLISAHGNSMRAIVKYLDKISDEKIPHLELPFGEPIIYEWVRKGLEKKGDAHSFSRPLHWKPHSIVAKKTRKRK